MPRAFGPHIKKGKLNKLNTLEEELINGYLVTHGLIIKRDCCSSAKKFSKLGDFAKTYFTLIKLFLVLLIMRRMSCLH